MDYGKLMKVASQTQRLNEYARDEKRYSTTITAAKKIEKEKKGILSANVRAFLEKKEKEEQAKDVEDRKKKDTLLKARQEARHMKRAHAMATRTKDNLKVFSDEQLQQFKEDEERRLQKMKEAQERTKNFLKDIAEGRKPRPVKPAEDGDKPGAKSRTEKSKHKEGDSQDRNSDSHKHDKHKHKDSDKSKPDKDRGPKSDLMKKNVKKEVKPVRRPNQPPPMSFDQLLQMAQKKLEDPAAFNPTVASAKKQEEKKKEPDRPMTQEEKDRNERKKSQEYQRFLKHGGLPPGASDPRKVKGQGRESMTKDKPTVNQTPAPSLPGKQTKPAVSPVQREASEARKATPTARPPSGPPSMKTLKPGAVLKPGLDRPSTSRAQPSTTRPVRPDQPKPKSKLSQPSNSVAYKVVGSGEKKRHIQEDGLSHWDRLYANYSINAKTPKLEEPARGRIESDEDYDSEMDDFIDDGDEENGYSSYIKEIFGYDKSRYANADEEDLSDMETGYDKLEKEEAYSAKVGYLEDLEDIRREEEEKKQKMLKKKMLAKKMKMKK